MRTSLRAALFASLLFAFGLVACSSPHGPAPLESVEAVAPMPQRPPIASVAPVGEAESGAQIRIRFTGDLVPLAALDDAGRANVLAHLTIAPKIAGRFVMWTPRMAGFVAEAPLPPATRVRVTVRAGLMTLSGTALAADYAWTFTTPKLELALDMPRVETPDGRIAASDVTPSLRVSANAAVELASLAEHTHFVSASQSVAAEAATPQPSPSPFAREAGEQSDESIEYRVRPAQALTKGTIYALVIDSGVEPQRGNLPSEFRVEGALRTYGDLRFTGVTAPEKTRFTAGDPVLQFSNTLAATFDPKRITIVPAPQPAGPIARVDGDGIAINPYALLPRTSYRVTVASGLADAFGQSTDAPVTASFTTSDLKPALWAPVGFTIFPATAGVQLNVETSNLPGNAYRARFAKITPDELIGREPADTALLGETSGWPVQHAPAQRNQTVVTAVPLAAKLNAPTGLIAYGVSAHGIDPFSGAVQLTDVGVSVTQFPGELIVRSARLRDGAPLQRAAVDIYPSLVEATLQRPPAAPPLAGGGSCASGTTDAIGTLALRGADFARCAASGSQSYGAPPLYVVVHSGADWSFARTSAYPDYFEGVPAGWSAGAPVSHGTIVADHDLFQPGETAHFVALAYYDENGSLTKAKASSYAITLRDPNGTVRTLGTRSPDAFGTFAFDAPFRRDAPLGFYTMTAKASNGEQLDGSIRVARFKAPNFRVALTLDRTVAAAAETVSAHAISTYLFGSPVDGGTQHWFVTRSAGTFAPKGWEQFAFGRQWIYPETQPDVPSDVLQRDAKLTGEANSSLDIPAGKDIPYPLTYRVEAQTTDASNLAVSDVQSFTVLPSNTMVGINAPYVATAGQPFGVKAIIVDPLGKSVGGHVTLTLARRAHDDATQIVQGGERAEAAVHYIDVATAEQLTGDQPVALTLTAPEPGEYRIRATISGEKNENTATDAYVWVTGLGEADWGAQDPNKVQVKLDKATYRVGDRASVLVQSPYAHAQAYVAVVRHGVMAQQGAQVNGAAPAFHFTVTADMLPNAAVQVVLIRRGALPAASDAAAAGKLSRSGMAAFNVALDQKYLRVSARPRTARVLPGGEQTLALHVMDAAGHPVSGQFAVAVVNESVLQLTGYRFPDLVQTVYASMPISLRFADNRADVSLITQRNAQGKGFGYGGGTSAGFGSTRVRTDFRSLAYFNPAVRSGPDGSASVSFTLPDDLTTWHVLAFALTPDARFGTADATFVASKPLVTNPLLPQFARLGDRFEAGVSVTDTLRERGRLSLQGAAAGAIAFAGNGRSRNTTLQTPIEQLTQAFRFPVTVTGSGDASFAFRSALGDNSDAFTVTLPILSQDVTESVIVTGATASTATLPLNVDAAVPKTYGGLDLTLAGTLVPELSVAIDDVLDRKEPFLLTVAAQVSVAASRVQLDMTMRKSPIVHRQRLAALVTALRGYALPDYGFAPWPQARKSELFSTAFAATALANARDAGADVAGDIARVRRFLEAKLADPGDMCTKTDDGCRAQARLEALETLVFLGDRRDDRLAEIYQMRESLEFYEQVELARVMVRLPGWRARGFGLRDKLFERVYETGRNATVNTPGEWSETPAAGQAQVVLLMLDSSVPIATIDKSVAALLAMRSNGRWPCACDAAEALQALSAYARLQKTPPDFAVTARVGPQSVQGSVRGFYVSSFERTIPIARLPAGRSAIELSKKGDGTLHYVAAYRYALAGDQPGRYAGIRVDRFVRAPADDTLLLSFGLARPVTPGTLSAGKVYEIEDRIVVDHAVDRVVVIDPLPAGIEAIDAAFRTSTQVFAARGDSWQIDYQSIDRDRVLAYASHLEAGVYAIHYLVRTVTPGTFSWPGAQSHLELAPEELGRTASSTVTIVQK